MEEGSRERREKQGFYYEGSVFRLEVSSAALLF